MQYNVLRYFCMSVRALLVCCDVAVFCNTDRKQWNVLDIVMCADRNSAGIFCRKAAGILVHAVW